MNGPLVLKFGGELLETPADRAVVVARFAAAPRRVRDVLPRAAERAVPAGEWGPRETLRHLIAVEREVWWVRLSALRTEDEPHWTWTEPGLEPGLGDATLDELAARFGEARARSIGIVDSFDDAEWTRTGVHETYGRLDVGGLLRIATDHDAEHLRSLGPD